MWIHFRQVFFFILQCVKPIPGPFYILNLSLNICFHYVLCVHSCFHGTYSSNLVELTFRNSICSAFHVVVKRAHDACIEALMWVIWKADVWNGKPAYYFWIQHSIQCIVPTIFIFAVFWKHEELGNENLNT